MSTLNTSNITVPSVATMVQHLVDSNPHPQYLLGTDLLSTVKASMHLGDLADVSLGASIPEDALIVYSQGTWVSKTAAQIWSSQVASYATVDTAGVVRLTASNGFNNTLDSSSVITPATLASWGAAQAFITSSSFPGALKDTLISWEDASSNVNIYLEQLHNVSSVGETTVGQYLVIGSFHNGHPVWVNKDLVTASANTSTFGIVKIATTDDVLYGTSTTFEEMESYGHSVPSVASLKDLFGDRYVSQVNSTVTPATTSVYSNIIGHESTQGTTGSGYVTVINTNGLVTDHVVSGGKVVVSKGHLVGVAAEGKVVTGASVTVTSGIVSVMGTGKAYDIRLGKYAKAVVGLGAGSTSVDPVLNAHADDIVLSGGSYDSNYIYTNMYNNLEVGSNGCVHQVVVGSDFESSVLSDLIISNATMSQGNVAVNSKGVVEHCIINACASLDVNNGGKVYHATLRGSKALVTVHPEGYLEDGALYSGASVVISSGGEINGLVAYESAVISVLSGGRLFGFVKYAGCNITSEQGAIIRKVGFTTSDTLVYSSNATDFNVSSGTDGVVVVFSANAHPTGLRKVTTDSSTRAVTHKFYQMAAETRVPNAIDDELNDYTLNVSGLSLWNDISTGNEYVRWFITF